MYMLTSKTVSSGTSKTQFELFNFFIVDFCNHKMLIFKSGTMSQLIQLAKQLSYFVIYSKSVLMTLHIMDYRSHWHSSVIIGYES